MRRSWTLLEYDNPEKLKKCLEDRDKRVLFYPAVGAMRVGQQVDVEVLVESHNVLVPLKAVVVGHRARPQGTRNPRGVFLEVIEADLPRFQRLCDLADGKWEPGTRRAEPRLRAHIRASYYVPPRTYRADTLDISPHGMFLRTDGPLPEIGKGVYVRLYSTPFWFPIALSTRVCWHDLVDSRRGMGLHSFDPPKSLSRMAALVKRLMERYKLGK